MQTPPRMPATPEELQEAMMLLGSRAQGMEMKATTQAQMVALLGKYPSPALAKTWKQELKRLAKESPAPRLPPRACRLCGESEVMQLQPAPLTARLQELKNVPKERIDAAIEVLIGEINGKCPLCAHGSLL